MSDTIVRPVRKLKGAARIVRLFGIDVHVHWSWVIVAMIQIQIRADAYSNILWNVIEYVCLFVIVLLHEFGHALACRSVGGIANDILLWPLGGIAYVRPPPRPGATLWSLAAGPLVNVVLVPFTVGAAVAAALIAPGSDLEMFATAMAFINVIVLAFNILPIYPLDGGQMLRSVLWYFIGPHRSLTIATGIGLAGAAAGLVLCLANGLVWLALFASFGLLSSWGGFRVARVRAALARQPRRHHVVCPECSESPPLGECWPCRKCGRPVDAFEPFSACRVCGHIAARAGCPFCGASIPAPQAGGPVVDVSARVVDATDSV